MKHAQSGTAVESNIDNDGFALLPTVYSAAQVKNFRSRLAGVFSSLANHSALLQRRDGFVYGARNLLQIFPESRTLWRKPSVIEVLRQKLGGAFGLVRVLYFDKPPGQSWALPWHKDLTIAVKDNRPPSRRFSKPTKKAGVPHVEATVELLEEMLTARIHLDDVTDENGPLCVLPGSHHTGKAIRVENESPRIITCRAGDVLLIRPLVAHCSSSAHPDTKNHRRILHFEFAGSPILVDNFQWHDYIDAHAC